MSDHIKRFLGNLADFVKVRTAITLINTFVIATMILKQLPIPEWYQQLSTTIYVFYFGTHYESNKHKYERLDKQ